MLTVKSKYVRDNFESLCDKVFHGETLVISRPKMKNTCKYTPMVDIIYCNLI